MDTLEKYILDRRVDPSFAARLQGLEQDDQQSLLRVISLIKPSANSLRGIFRLLEEIAHRDAKSMSQILSEPSISELLSAENLNGKALQAKLIEMLEGIRYPERAIMNAKLKGKLKELVREFGVAVAVPDELEGDSIVLTIKARSCEEISQKAEKLLKMGEHPACKEVYSILLGESE